MEGERLNQLEITVGRHNERLGNLEMWQDKQNGCLQRLEHKIDNLNKWLIALLGGVITSLLLLILRNSGRV